MLQIASTNEEKVPVTATPQTSTGKPAQVDGPLRVTVQSGDATVEQDSATPLSFNAVSGDSPGTSVFLVEADADLGEGVQLIQDTVEYVVSGSAAASFGLSAGAAVPKA
jgi:hypothetical protein